MGLRRHNPADDGNDSDDAVEEISLADAKLESARKKKDEKTAQLRAAADAKNLRRKQGQKSKDGDEGGGEEELTSKSVEKKRGEGEKRRDRRKRSSLESRLAGEDTHKGGAEKGEGSKVDGNGHQDRQAGDRLEAEAISGADGVADPSLLLPEDVLLAIAEEERRTAVELNEGQKQTPEEVQRKKKKQKTKSSTSRPHVEISRLPSAEKAILPPPSAAALKFRQGKLYGKRVERSLQMLAPKIFF